MPDDFDTSNYEALEDLIDKTTEPVETLGCTRDDIEVEYDQLVDSWPDNAA